MVKVDAKTNTMKRFAGDGGKITSFHITLNHNNLKPLLSHISPEKFKEKTRGLHSIHHKEHFLKSNKIST